MSNWIKCSDKLPADELPVLILMFNGDKRIAELRWEIPSWEETFLPFQYWDCPYNDGQDWDWCDVTHWQPLPAPPEE